MPFQRAFAATVFAAAILLSSVAVQAASPTTGEILTKFNAVVNGNFQTTSDVEGPAIIGGNLAGSASFLNFGTQLGVSLAGFAQINVFGSAGNATYNANGLSVKVGGPNVGGYFSGASSLTYNASFPNTMTDIWSKVTGLSTGLAALSPTTPAASLPAAGSNNAVLTATPTTINGVAGVAVIDIAASLLGSYTGVSVNLNGASTVIINVAGNYSGFPNFQNGAAWRNAVIWNFENATQVNLGSQGMQGTVLAPFATVTNGTPIDGGLYAANYVGNGELHYKPFTGNTTFLDSVGPQDAVGVPEPASMALLGAGLAGLALVRRRNAK